MEDYYLVIDNVWHSIHLSTLHGSYLHQRVLDHYEEIERDNLEQVSIAPDANWRMISVMLVTKKTHVVWLRYFGTHAQILEGMQEKARIWERLGINNTAMAGNNATGQFFASYSILFSQFELYNPDSR